MWRDDLNFGLAAFGIQIPDRFPIDEWANKLTNKPAANTLSIVAISAGIFFAAEKNHNPKVNSIYDALVYCSTCLSVGYHDIFPRTPVGKLVGTLLMTVGPALAARTLDGPKRDDAQAKIASNHDATPTRDDRSQHSADQQQILDALVDIAKKLQP